MNGTKQTFLALAGALLLTTGIGSGIAAQTPAAAPRPKLLSPIRGQAEVWITTPASKREGTLIVTTIRVINKSAAPIAGLKVDESWYSKSNDPVSGGTFRNPKPLMPGEVVDVVIKTPTTPTMYRNAYSFTHANGTIKPTTVAKIEAPKKTT